MRLARTLAVAALLTSVACDSKTPPPASPVDATAQAEPEPIPQGMDVSGAETEPTEHEEEKIPFDAKPGTAQWFVQAFVAFRGGDLDPIVANFGADMTWEAVGSPLAPPSEGVFAVLERWDGLLTGIPDMKLSAERIFKKDNLIVCQVVLTGTHSGLFRGLEPTNKPVGTKVLAWIWHNDRGEAQKVRIVYNEGALLAQMGVLEGAEVPAVPEHPTATPEVIELEADAKPNTKTEKFIRGWAGSWGPKSWKACQKKYCAKELVSHDTSRGKTMKEPAQHEAASKGFASALPDLKTTPVEVVTVGDWALVHATMKGTHKGPLGNIEATNKTVELDYSAVAKLEGGKIVETWGYSNHLQLLSQLGLFQKPGAPAPAAAPAK